MDHVWYFLVLIVHLLCQTLAHEGQTLTGAKEIFDNEVFSSHHLVMVDHQLPIPADNDDNTQDGSSNNAAHLLSFSPSSIDFDKVAIGEPASKTITVYNRHSNQSVYLGSIMGNVPDFYTSLFSDKVIPPEGKRFTAVLSMHTRVVCIYFSFSVYVCVDFFFFFEIVVSFALNNK